jgi:hypothetical protein
MRRRALAVLAAYYLATGAWPLVSMRSFEALTGPKTDRWLVKTVGTLALANGVALAFGTVQDEIADETIVLAACSALAFASIDLVYVARGRISPIYLGDAALELALAATILASE